MTYRSRRLLDLAHGTTPSTVPVLGYEGLYTVDVYGTVRSVSRSYTNSRGQNRRVVGRPIAACPSKKTGYMYVTLWPIKRSHLVHRLVLLSFLGQPEDGMEAMHLDGDKTNNSLANLAWGSKKENASHKEAHGTKIYGERSPNSKLTNAHAVEIRDLRSQGFTYNELAQRFAVSITLVAKVIRREAWIHDLP